MTGSESLEGLKVDCIRLVVCGVFAIGHVDGVQPLRPTSKFGLRHWPSALQVVFKPTNTMSTASRRSSMRLWRNCLSFSRCGAHCPHSDHANYTGVRIICPSPFPPSVSKFCCWRGETTRVLAGKVQVHFVTNGFVFQLVS